MWQTKSARGTPVWKRLVGSMLSSIPAASTYGNASMKLQTLGPDFCNDVSYICMPYTTYTTFTGPVRLTRKVVLLFHGHIFKISVLRLCPRKFIKYMYAPWTCNVHVDMWDRIYLLPVLSQVEGCEGGSWLASCWSFSRCLVYIFRYVCMDNLFWNWTPQMIIISVAGIQGDFYSTAWDWKPYSVTSIFE